MYQKASANFKEGKSKKNRRIYVLKQKNNLDHNLYDHIRAWYVESFAQPW